MLSMKLDSNQIQFDFVVGQKNADSMKKIRRKLSVMRMLVDYVDDEAWSRIHSAQKKLYLSEFRIAFIMLARQHGDILAFVIGVVLSDRQKSLKTLTQYVLPDHRGQLITSELNIMEQLVLESAAHLNAIVRMLS